MQRKEEIVKDNFNKYLDKILISEFRYLIDAGELICLKVNIFIKPKDSSKTQNPYMYQ